MLEVDSAKVEKNHFNKNSIMYCRRITVVKKGGINCKVAKFNLSYLKWPLEKLFQMEHDFKYLYNKQNK